MLTSSCYVSFAVGQDAAVESNRGNAIDSRKLCAVFLQVGDKTIAMWLFDAEVYTNMSSLNEATDITKRGMCLHKVRERVREREAGHNSVCGAGGWVNKRRLSLAAALASPDGLASEPRAQSRS
jgi:hypothetical protein